MADSSVSYKCPNCGAPLSFLPGKTTVTCEYCGTEFEVSAIEELFRDKQEMAVQAAAAQEARWEVEAAGSDWSDDEVSTLQLRCRACLRRKHNGDRVRLLRQPDNDSKTFRRHA